MSRIGRTRYRDIVRAFAGRRIIVLGDLMVDEYVWGRATRISPESPVMVVEVDRESFVPGGAANVVNNLLALGARVTVVGVVGDDDKGRTLVGALEERGASTGGICVDACRPTTRKTRVIAHSQQVLRVDREQSAQVDERLAQQMLQYIRAETPGHDALLISDYNKGVLTPALAAGVVTTCHAAGRIVTGNPKPPNASSLRGADLLSVNQSEAGAIMASLPAGSACPDAFGDKHKDTDDYLNGAGRALIERLGVANLVVTRGSRGLSVWHADGAIQHIAAHPVEVYDVAGAGDTVISVLTLGMAVGASVEEAAILANHAAAAVVCKVGVAPVTTDELLRDW